MTSSFQNYSNPVYSLGVFLTFPVGLMILTFSSLALFRISTLFLAEIAWEISPAWVLLFINSNSMSFGSLKRSFLNPLTVYLVALAFLYPILTSLGVDLYFLLVRLSIPLGLLHDSSSLMYLSEWNLLNGFTFLNTFFFLTNEVTPMFTYI